ncbi:Outer membrane receptor proteins, mostly Fe transport [Tenacibaculum mesophilum]|uniref:TonB-dependent receptor n=1 Tax=Tenacibaculum mesophilum TaxID=104268 RepID=A0ABN5T814_9FLAO|nr:outer membrane beta-barrel protein [Tenacibaculum mesophilum]AZJ33477.1 TonB-dependent receptor [Tenacibaculum mesophilum]QFS28718.1 outer membrane beta-barrel protein [Tenacibaculum mesophilum]SHF60117.1 Outer membrane receptor proteins, mostly Fe transport [Tenacibaculum mesophilum]
MKKLLFIFTLLLTSSIFAQSYPFKITGTINSEKDKTTIEAATVHLERAKDSSIVTYTISNDKGKFSLEGKSFSKDVKLFISYVGMDSFSKLIELDKTSNLNLGTIFLKEESNVLSEVVIQSRAPITVKKDTLEFNVKSFKTKKDANVEDLLKKLPGVEVDENGKITVNGKEVNKILVNGKPFFGNDPSITTKNLTKDIIEKVQITDTKSKSEAFTGEKGDANNKTINLTIKKENNKGWFGRVSGGAGTDKRFEGAAMVNRFDNNQRFSILASTNNINSPGFSFGEIQKMFGGGGNIWIGGNGSFNVNGRSFGGGSGIIKSKTAGATYADEFGKGLDVNANYFYSGSNSNNESKSNREYTLPDRKYFSNSTTTSDDENHNHSFDTEFDIEIDSTLLINVRPTFIFNKRESNSRRQEESLNENNTLTNSYVSSTYSKATANNFQNKLDITKKIGAKGSFIKASITNSIDKTDTEEFNKSIIETFGNNASTENRDQKSIIENNLTGLSSRLTYRFPLIAKKLFLDTKYSYQRDERKNQENTFDFNSTTQQYSDFNTELSSDFTYNDITKTPSVDLVYRSKKWRLNFGTGFVNRTLENNDKLRPELSLKKEYNNLDLDASFRYRFDSKASIYFDYRLNNNAPSINQVQPFSDVTNPSNIVTGNPNLKPAQNHRAYINFNKFNWQARTGFWFYISGTLYENQVITNTSIDDNLVRKTSYENNDGGYDLWGGGSYTKKIKLDSISSIKFRAGGNIGSNKNFNILNNIKEGAKTTSLTPNFGITLEWDKLASIETQYRISFSNTKYDVNTDQNQDFTRHSVNIRTKTNIPKKLEWLNDIRYTYNPNVIGFNKAAWFWNATLAYSILKDQGTISLKAYDLLNQNTNAQRRATSNYIEDSESTVLQQYFMLGFSWKFNSLGKKGKIQNYDFRF